MLLKNFRSSISSDRRPQICNKMGSIGPEVMACERRSGIDVLVVGAGIGGLFCAIELHRQGHDVQVLESKDGLDGIGLFIIASQSRRTTSGSD